MTPLEKYNAARAMHALATARGDTRLMNTTAAALRIATAQLLKAEGEAKKAPRRPWWKSLFDFAGWA